MPVITTTASLSSRGFSSNTPTLLDEGQWINTITLPTSFPNSGLSGFRLVPTSTGNLYVITDGSLGITKFNNTGASVFQKRTNGGSSDYSNCAIAVDSDENIYVGGISGTGRFILIKYNSSGVLQWQRNIVQGGSTITGVWGIQFDSSNNPLILVVNDGTSTKCILVKYNTTGTLLSQRNILTVGSFPKLLGLDVYNNSVIVGGIDAFPVGYTYYIGIYPWSNTTTSNTLLYQTGPSGYFAMPTNTGIVSDSSYYYQVIRLGSYVFQKIDKITGNIIYSKNINYNSTDTRLTGIALDNSGFVYVTGTNQGSSYTVYIGKFYASTGAVVWEKTVTGVGASVNGNFYPTLYWSNNYLYFIASIYNTSVAVYNGYIKLSDSGSLPDGTYASYFQFTTITSTITTVNSTSTGTITDSVVNTSFSAATTAYTAANSTYTITTTAIP